MHPCLAFYPSLRIFPFCTAFAHLSCIVPSILAAIADKNFTIVISFVFIDNINDDDGSPAGSRVTKIESAKINGAILDLRFRL